MHQRTVRVLIVLNLLAGVVLLAACAGSDPLIYRAGGSANQVEVTYTDADGASHTDTVSLPWETTFKAGASTGFSLVVQNQGDQGDISCSVLLGERELGHADATQYASCEGSYKKTGGSLSVKFDSSRDVLPDGSSAVTLSPEKSSPTEAEPTEVAVPAGAGEAPLPTPAPDADPLPRTNGGGSGLVAFVGRQTPWPTNRTELFLLAFDGSEASVAPLTEEIGWADNPVWSPDGSKLLFARSLYDSGSIFTGDLWLWDTGTGELRDLTAGSDDQGFAEWSPGGSRIVFVSTRDGNSDVYVMDADGSGTVNLTQNAAEDRSPQWSPDGKTIYFVSDRDDRWYEVFTMDPDGGNLRKLTDNTGRIWWMEVSSTGQLAYLRDRDIYVANADGTGETNLTNEGTQRHFPRFAWSPDGTKIAFDSARAGEKNSSGLYGVDIYVMDADGSNVVRLTTHPEDDEQPQWTPDGTMISFVSLRDGQRQLYLVNPNGTGVMRLAERADWRDFRPAWQPSLATSAQAALPDKPLRLPTPMAVPAPAAAGDALEQNRIFFASDRDGDKEIYAVRTDGSDLTQITDNDAYDGQPVPSPDGTAILFVSDRDGNAEIYRMAPDGSGVARLTDDPAVDEYPVWAPNGQAIAFASHRGKDADLYLMRADGSDVTPFVTGPGKDWMPAWSYAGPEVAFISDRDGEFDLYIADVDANVRRLTQDLGTVYSPSWSPNGRFIAFAANPGGNYDIYIIKPDGTGLQQVTDHEASDYMPQWSPDSNYIAFVSTRDGNPEIYVANEAGDVHRVTDSPAEEIFPAWGPLDN